MYHIIVVNWLVFVLFVLFVMNCLRYFVVRELE